MGSKRHWISLALCPTLLVMAGCTSFGSRASLIDADRASNIVCYHLDRLYVTYDFEGEDGREITDDERARAVRLIGRLAEQELHRQAAENKLPALFLLNDGISAEYLDPADASALCPEPSDSLPVDDLCAGEAVLTIEIWKPGMHGENVAAYLHFFPRGDTTALMVVNHNTKWGNTYWTSIPGYSQTVPDAIKGSLHKAADVLMGDR